MLAAIDREEVSARFKPAIPTFQSGRAISAYARLRIPEEDGLSFDPIIVPRRGRPPAFIRIVRISGPARNPFLGARGLLILSEARTTAYLAKGLSATEIAEGTGRSRQTIKSHLKSIFEKTGVRS